MNKSDLRLMYKMSTGEFPTFDEDEYLTKQRGFTRDYVEFLERLVVDLVAGEGERKELWKRLVG